MGKLENVVYVSKTCVGNIEETELDIVLGDEFNAYDNENEGIVEIDRSPLPKAYNEQPINIETLMNDLEQLKSKGATHIQMSYHIDHIGYEISGMKIELADDELIKKYTEYHQKRNELENEVKSHYNSIYTLKKKIGEL